MTTAFWSAAPASPRLRQAIHVLPPSPHACAPECCACTSRLRTKIMAAWSSGMILGLGPRGPRFNSQSSPSRVWGYEPCLLEPSDSPAEERCAQDAPTTPRSHAVPALAGWPCAVRAPAASLSRARGRAKTVSTPGVEPGLSRPQRDVLTTRRCGLLRTDNTNQRNVGKPTSRTP